MEQTERDDAGRERGSVRAVYNISGDEKSGQKGIMDQSHVLVDSTWGARDAPTGCWGTEEASERPMVWDNEPDVDARWQNSCDDKHASTAAAFDNESKATLRPRKPLGLSADETWSALKTADEGREIDEIKTAFKLYTRSDPETTYDKIEKRFRIENFNTHIIALDKIVPVNLTLYNLQGEPDQKYTVVLQLGAKSRRSRATADMTASSPEENMARLAQAGEPGQSKIPVCYRCHQRGHRIADCTDAINVVGKLKLECANCGAQTHRMRDCPHERLAFDSLGLKCRSCNGVGHKSIDCPDKSNFACYKCGQEGHTSRDCTQYLNMDKLNLQNNSQSGYISLDSPTRETHPFLVSGGSDQFSKEYENPRNGSDANCNYCHAVGHFVRACPQLKLKEQNALYNRDQKGATQGIIISALTGNIEHQLHDYRNPRNHSRRNEKLEGGFAADLSADKSRFSTDNLAGSIESIDNVDFKPSVAQWEVQADGGNAGASGW